VSAALVEICEVGPRDGLQIEPRVPMSLLVFVSSESGCGNAEHNCFAAEPESDER
jgi:hypothetical protein